MQPTKRAVIHTIARSRTYSHSLVDGNYGSWKKNSITQTDCTFWKHTFFEQEVQFDSTSNNFSEESRKTYGMALKYVNRFHHLMNSKLRGEFEHCNDCETNEVQFIFPNVPDYSSLFSVILRKPKSARCRHQSKYGDSSPDFSAKEHPKSTIEPLPKVKKNSKLTTVNEGFQKKLNSFKYINVDENECDQNNYFKDYDCYITPSVSPREEQLSKLSESNTFSKEKSEKIINRTGLMYSKNEQPNSHLDLLKGHLLEDLWNNYLKLDKPKHFKQRKLEKTCFSIVNIQPAYISLIDYAQNKIDRNVNLDTISPIKNEKRRCLPYQESNIPPSKSGMTRPNAPIKVKNMFDNISKSQEKIVSRKIFESKTFKIHEDESDTDSIILDDVEFEKMSQRSHYAEGTEIFNKSGEKSGYSNNGKSNPLKLNGKDITKLNEKMLSAIGLFTDRGDIRPGIIDVLEEHKKLKSKDTRNKQFRSKRQWDIQIHLKPKKEPQSSLPSVSSDKSFISLSSDIRLQVKNAKSQFLEIDKDG